MRSREHQTDIAAAYGDPHGEAARPGATCAAAPRRGELRLLNIFFPMYQGIGRMMSMMQREWENDKKAWDEAWRKRWNQEQKQAANIKAARNQEKQRAANNKAMRNQEKRAHRQATGLMTTGRFAFLTWAGFVAVAVVILAGLTGIALHVRKQDEGRLWRAVQSLWAYLGLVFAIGFVILLFTGIPNESNPNPNQAPIL